MKSNIHPQYYQTVATCACGATYEIGSTAQNIRVDICSNCHPLFTGQQKIIDVEGRVDRFKRKYTKYSTGKTATKAKNPRAKAKAK